jgi:hypothetical protein
VTHVFVAPHPDDVALSCGGLIATIREAGKRVTIITVFSGVGAATVLTTYQREALGFGSKAVWPTTEAFNRESIAADQPSDARAGAPYRAAPARLDATQADADAATKCFWQRPSWYRRADIHNRPLAARPFVALLGLGRRWVMPGLEYAEVGTYYEDSPCAWWDDFRRLDDLPAGAFDGLTADVGLTPAYADISETVERKFQGLTFYESQLERLFGGTDQMGDAVRVLGTKVASLGGLPGFAERHWASSRL